MSKLYLTLILLLSQNYIVHAQTRVKDLVTIKGVRENPLIGYGLVIGLNGTGDGGGEITSASLKRMFQKLGLNLQNEINSKNVAAVIVTAKLPPFARVGQSLDVTISSIGDAKSLAGGTLLITPLKGGDGHIYAVANGPVSTGGLSGGKKFGTVGKVPNGGIIEKELELNFHKKKSLRLNLKNPDFTTAARLKKVINESLGGKYAMARDSSTIDLVIPTNYERNVVELIAVIENFKVTSDQSAKIVINERTGTIVAGGDVHVKNVAISHGELTIQVGEGEEQAQPKSIYMHNKGTTLNDLVNALNALGAAPDDMISIFQALERNGALIGDLDFI